MKKVLCLDDDATIAQMVANAVRYCAFELQVEMEPVTCFDSTEAIIQFSRADFAVAIVDLMMPRISGIEVLAAFQEGSPKCRRILLTAAPNEPDVLRAAKEGIIQLVIAKPPGIADFRTALAWL
jgi:CheY-like chemotaxis protein